MELVQLLEGRPRHARRGRRRGERRHRPQTPPVPRRRGGPAPGDEQRRQEPRQRTREGRQGVGAALHAVRVLWDARQRVEGPQGRDGVPSRGRGEEVAGREKLAPQVEDGERRRRGAVGEGGGGVGRGGERRGGVVASDQYPLQKVPVPSPRSPAGSAERVPQRAAQQPQSVPGAPRSGVELRGPVDLARRLASRADRREQRGALGGAPPGPGEAGQRPAVGPGGGADAAATEEAAKGASAASSGAAGTGGGQQQLAEEGGAEGQGAAAGRRRGNVVLEGSGGVDLFFFCKVCKRRGEREK